MSAPTAASSRSPRSSRTAAVPRLRGFAWVVWRRHRTTAWTALALLVTCLAGLVWLRSALLGHVDAHFGGCPDPECLADDPALGRFRASGPVRALYWTGLLLQWLPVLLGAFTAGPMIARELESGTHRLAWTQSGSPGRWFAAKLTVVTAAGLAGLSLLSAARTWAWRPVEKWLPEQFWFLEFERVGPVPVAYGLLGIALGALVGLLVGRTVPAMFTTAAAYVAAWWGLRALRPRLTATETLFTSRTSLFGTDTWPVRSGFVDSHGVHLASTACRIADTGYERCLAARGLAPYVEGHPVSHLWPLQWAESGIVLGCALAVAAVAVGWLRRTRG
ncbi:hypothetical protein [Streptomyces sp. NPDC002537]